LNRAEATITIKADCGRCFEYVTDPVNVPRFMAAITRYEPQTEKQRGKGARFDSVAEIAGRRFETVLVISDWKEGERMAVASNGSLKLQSSWIFEQFDDGTTDVTLVNEYEPPGIFKLMGGLVRSAVEKGTEQSLDDLKRQVEGLTQPPGSKRSAEPDGAKVKTR
jgi:uncharacterized membrane protein